MNKERLLAVAEAIGKEPKLYNQRDWGAPWCGTPGCIAGHTVALFSDSKELPKVEPLETICSPVFNTTKARDMLGLTSMQKYPLFSSAWPVSWLPDCDNGINFPGSEFFTPTARDAQRVLYKIIIGDIEL